MKTIKASVKNLLILITLVSWGIVMTCGMAQSQTPKADIESAQKAEKALDRLDAKVKLTPEQKAKVKALFQDRTDKIKAINDDPKLTPDQKKAKVKEVRKSTRQAIKGVLTAQQKEELAKHHGMLR
ncbi:MAG: DUF1542 domain-containing protein [Deltaproteobacteria bacterium]|nr:DUF1542 domain-containing protein [Deltaproteobacteria bacterium]